MMNEERQFLFRVLPVVVHDRSLGGFVIMEKDRIPRRRDDRENERDVTAEVENVEST